jgi:hypothetical protein
MFAVALGVMGASSSAALKADEYSEKVRTRAGAGPVARKAIQQQVTVVESSAAAFRIVPPCADRLFPELLKCQEPEVVLVPPHDGAVRNALHGLPPRRRGPFPTLFSW